MLRWTALRFVAVGVFAVVGGISRCTPLISIVIALLCAQLLLIIIVRPYATLFENVYSAVTLGLTVVSVAGQLVFTTAASGEAMRTDWALTLSAVCDFVKIGVSLVKAILDGYGVVMGVYRRVSMRRRCVEQQGGTTRSPAAPAAMGNETSVAQ